MRPFLLLLIQNQFSLIVIGLTLPGINSNPVMRFSRICGQLYIGGPQLGRSMLIVVGAVVNLGQVAPPVGIAKV